MATPLTFTLPAGTYSGTKTLGPFTIPAGYTLSEISLGNVSTADYENAANGVDAGLYLSRDGGTTFEATKATGFTWRGGRVVTKAGAVDPLPIVSQNGLPQEWAGLTVRALVVVTGSFRFSATVTLT